MVTIRLFIIFCMMALMAPSAMAQGEASTGPMVMPPRPMAPTAAAPVEDKVARPADGPSTPLPPAPATEAPARAARPPIGDVDLILFDQQDLARLRLWAGQGSPQWTRLIRWAMDPQRQNIRPADGPGLALAALVLRQDDPAVSQKLSRLAVRCLLEGARYGRVESASGNTILDGGLPWKPDELRAEGYDTVVPFQRDEVLPVERITTTKLIVRSPSNLAEIMQRGQAYHLVFSDVRLAADMVENVALTMCWSFDMLHPKERRDIADWLRAQAAVFAEEGMGCFDVRSAAILKIEALAARAGLRFSDRAPRLMDDVYDMRFGKVWAKALGLPGGGGWFGGTYAGAMAGWDLAISAMALPDDGRRQAVLRYDWYQNRQAVLTSCLLPQADQSVDGPYRGPCPSGDSMLPPVQAADLTRMQLLLLRRMLPQAPMSRAAQAMLLATDAPAVTQADKLFYEFILLDVVDPGRAMALAPVANVDVVTGRAYSRTGWTPWDTLVAFNCGPHYAMPQHLGAGSVQIFLNGPLLARAGAYDGPASSHAQNFAIRSVAHNTILIKDPAEYSWYDMRSGAQPRGTYSNDGGQRAWATFEPNGSPLTQAPWTASGMDSGDAPWSALGPIYQSAGIVAHDNSARFAYFCGDATAAYVGSTGKARRVMRHVVHLRPGGPDDATAAEVVLLVDDVELARPNLEVAAVFHFTRPPQIPGEMKQLGPGRLEGRANSILAANGTSALWLISVAAQPEVVRLIGGPAADWVDGKSYPPMPPAENPAPYRVELSPASGGLKQVMVHALVPVPDPAQQPPGITALGTDDPELVGVVIKDRMWPRVVAVRLMGPQPDKPVVYAYPQGRSRHLVCGVSPGVEYSINATGGIVTIAPGKGVKASEGGTLAFRLAPAQDNTQVVSGE